MRIGAHVTKNGLIGTSFVAAIPAGVMAYFSVMAFLNYATDMPTMLQVVNGTALLFCALMTLSPIAILLFVRKPGEDAEAEDHSESELSAEDLSQAEQSAVDIATADPSDQPTIDEDAFAEEVAMIESEDEDDLGYEATQDFTVAEEESDEDLGDSSFDLGSESFEFDQDDFDFDDEELT